VGRVIIGCLLVAWAFLIVPANLSGPYATVGDLFFGYFVLVLGFVLVFSGAFRTRSRGDSGTGASRETSGSVPGLVQRIAEEVMVSVLAAAVLALITRFLG